VPRRTEQGLEHRQHREGAVGEDHHRVGVGLPGQGRRVGRPGHGRDVGATGPERIGQAAVGVVLGRQRPKPQARNARRQLEALGYDVIITLREDAA
jgi:hypothetical protein